MDLPGDEADAQFGAVRNEPNLPRSGGREEGGGLVGTVDDDGVKPGTPVAGQFGGEGDQLGEWRGQLRDGFFENRQSGGGQLDVIHRTQDQSAEQGLKGGVRSVLADDVEKIRRSDGARLTVRVWHRPIERGGAAQIGFDHGRQGGLVKRAGPRFEERCAGSDELEPFRGHHECCR